MRTVTIPLEEYESLRDFKKKTMEKLPAEICVNDYGNLQWKTTEEVKKELENFVTIYFQKLVREVKETESTKEKIAAEFKKERKWWFL